MERGLEPRYQISIIMYTEYKSREISIELCLAQADTHLEKVVAGLKYILLSAAAAIKSIVLTTTGACCQVTVYTEPGLRMKTICDHELSVTWAATKDRGVLSS